MSYIGRYAYLLFQNLSESRLGSGLVEKHGDSDPRVLDAYHLQSLAEAQEGINLHNLLILLTGHVLYFGSWACFGYI